VSNEPSTFEARGNRKEREKYENNPCTLPTRYKEKRLMPNERQSQNRPSTYEAGGNIKRKRDRYPVRFPKRRKILNSII
jgi:hypothetical protein